MVDRAGRATVLGRDISADEALVWVPGEETHYVLQGPYHALEIGVSAELVDEQGWRVSGHPARSVSSGLLAGLGQLCQLAADNVDFDSFASVLYWRDHVLDALERVLVPWTQDDAESVIENVRSIRLATIVRDAIDYFDALAADEPCRIDELAEQIGVPTRTVFYACRKLLGVGPRRYYELKRLHSLRARLKESHREETTVASVAAEFGFGDKGRMAARYRECFGENPCETLRH